MFLLAGVCAVSPGWFTAKTGGGDVILLAGTPTVELPSTLVVRYMLYNTACLGAGTVVVMPAAARVFSR